MTHVVEMQVLQVMKVRSPYDPPGMEAGALGTGLSPSDWNRAVKVFVGWTVVSALLGGAAGVMEAGWRGVRRRRGTTITFD